MLLQEDTSYLHLLRFTSFLNNCLRGSKVGPQSLEKGVLLELLGRAIPYFVPGVWLPRLDWAQTNEEQDPSDFLSSPSPCSSPLRLLPPTINK